MIQSWRGEAAQAIFEGRWIRSSPADLAKATRIRLARVDEATSIEDLRTPPSHRLHLVADRWSLSVNMQYRITFLWGANGPEEVWFGDYH